MEHTSPERSSHPTSHASSHSSSHESPSASTYYIVYGALLILLLLTVLAARVDLGAWSVVVALLIAAVKALLVFLYFMHLRYSSRLVWVFAGASLVWLLILFSYTITDYLTRGWIGN